MKTKVIILFSTILLFLASCSVKNSCQSLEIYNSTKDTIIVNYCTKTKQGSVMLPFVADASNTPIVNSVEIYNSYYLGIDKLPLLSNDDLVDIISKLEVYKVYNGDTFKLDVDFYNNEYWKLKEFVDDETRAYYYTFSLDKNDY